MGSRLLVSQWRPRLYFQHAQTRMTRCDLRVRDDSGVDKNMSGKNWRMLPLCFPPPDEGAPHGRRRTENSFFPQAGSVKRAKEEEEEHGGRTSRKHPICNLRRVQRGFAMRQLSFGCGALSGMALSTTTLLTLREKRRCPSLFFSQRPLKVSPAPPHVFGIRP